MTKVKSKRPVKTNKRTNKSRTLILHSKAYIDKFILLAKKGFSDRQICKVLEIDKQMFINLKKNIDFKILLDKTRTTLKDNEKTPAYRQTDYQPKYCKMIIDYFKTPPYKEIKVDIYDKKGNLMQTRYEKEPNDIPTLEKFATDIGVTRQTLHNWRELHPEWNEAFLIAKDLQKNTIIQNGTRGLYNSVFSKLVMINETDYTEKADITSSGKPLKANTYIIPAFKTEIEEPEDDETEEIT